MHVHVLRTFTCVSAASAASPAPTHPSIKEAALRAASTKGGGRLRRPPPFVDSFMDGFVEAKEAAGAAQTHVNLGKTCTCMHILRATSDPQGHHGRAQRPGEQGFSNVFTNTKKTRSVRTIILPAVSRRDLCYASENEGFRFYQIPPSPSTFAVDSHEPHEPYKPLEPNRTNRSNRTNRNRTNRDAPRTALNRNEPRTPWK